ncbi:NAD(P)/FAD-dependent oxidoreductase [Streptomyces sp. NBC_00249]|uniref:NAD(P)/FAD-dependent oxidoreductase n=1 Tax=Streptomyces sp. NBC_00249 TaxID=2975690 RepID=UPI00225879C9|nr:FAD-dependent oxidoreductase [Streptomyces sp. NBC_00249]MCX5193083.1 NAD(P)/FAD-dependent oxidoreductase [Streptomyces sp. NBC_00249]
MTPAHRTDALVDVLVVGAGPAGLALAARLARAGAGRVEVLEREQDAGGMPRHLHHGGFGRPPRPWLRGPEYARRSLRAALAAGAAVRTGVTATGWAGPLSLETTSPAGLERITARAVVLATGARERPRSARLVPGSRPQGVLTTGELFRSVHGYGLPVGRRAVVVGAEPVARHAVATLRRAGTEVVAVVTERPRAAAVPGVPLLTATTVGELRGRGRLTGVAVRHRDGRSGVLACDTVVFTGDWIPDHELARRGGVPLDPGTRGPRVDASFRTPEPGVFAVGNALHGIERAATAAGEGAAAAAPVLEHLAGAPWPRPGPPLEVRSPLLWVTPNRLTGTAGRPLLLRSGEPSSGPVVRVVQDGRLLWRRRVLAPVSPSRSLRLPPGWTARVDPDGGPVVLDIG